VRQLFGLVFELQRVTPWASFIHVRNVFLYRGDVQSLSQCLFVIDMEQIKERKATSGVGVSKNKIHFWALFIEQEEEEEEEEEERNAHICYRSLILERSTAGTTPSRSFLGQDNLFKVLMIHRPFLLNESFFFACSQRKRRGVEKK
jgi:hypothetical protein